jgi:hypothetical protein
MKATSAASDSYLHLLLLPERLEGIQLWGLQRGTAAAALASAPAGKRGTLGCKAHICNAFDVNCSLLLVACIHSALMRARLVSEKMIQMQQ